MISLVDNISAMVCTEQEIHLLRKTCDTILGIETRALMSFLKFWKVWLLITFRGVIIFEDDEINLILWPYYQFVFIIV